MSKLKLENPDAKLEATRLLPGMAVIAIWMLAQCGIGLIGVFLHKFPVGALLICFVFALAANGLLKLKRWGWALTLAAAFLSMTYAAVMLFLFHQIPKVPMFGMMLVNLVFFLYLIRPEVLERVK